MNKKKVIVSLSGGKDSTASIILLKNQNHEVHAFTMKLGLDGEEEKLKKVERLANTMKIPLKVLDIEETFKEKIIGYFRDSYAQGKTPNPCIICNKVIKFDLLLNKAIAEEDADYYATGHYANKIWTNGQFLLKEPKERSKSQIYFLSMIKREHLNRILFPLAQTSLKQVWEMVEGLPLVSKQESQDVCFLGNQNLREYLKKVLPSTYFQPGDILNIDGAKIGEHKGAVYFTIGQRRGTNFPSDRKLYVIKKDVVNNTITLGDAHHLYSNSIKVSNPVFWKRLRVGEVFQVKIRYLSPLYTAEIREVSDQHILADFKEPVKSMTPGQVGVFFQEDTIVAAGFI
jgi:tRNA-specific 2-thiouridylase